MILIYAFAYLNVSLKEDGIHYTHSQNNRLIVLTHRLMVSKLTQFNAFSILKRFLLAYANGRETYFWLLCMCLGSEIIRMWGGP